MVEARAEGSVAGTVFRSATLALAEGDLPYLVGGSGPLVVLSYTLGPLAWGPLDRLAARCTVVVVDQPAAALGPEVIGSYYWLRPLAGALGFARAALCTWSLGTPAALRFAASVPAILSHLVLVDPGALRMGMVRRSWPEQPGPGAVEEMVAGMWRFWVRDPAVNTASLRELHARLLRAPGGYEGNRRANAGAVQRPLLDILPLVEVPTLLLAGRHSGVFGPEAGAAALARLAHGRLLLFEESSHAIPLEEPARFQDEVAAFVTSAPDAAAV